MPSILPSIGVFSNQSDLRIRGPKYWSFSISPSNEYSGLAFFRIDWFDLAIQGTLKSLFHHHSPKAYVHFIQFTSVAQSCPTHCDPMNHSRPGLPVHHQLPTPKPMSIESVMPTNHLILCRPLLLLPSIFPSIRVFSNESALCIKWPKYWSFSISPFKEYSDLISFRIDWFDLPPVQGTLKSFSSTTIGKHQYFGVQTSLWSNSHICT